MVLRILLLSLIGWIAIPTSAGFASPTWLGSSCVADSGVKILVRGKVFDKLTNQPLAAQVTYRLATEEEGGIPVTLDPATGEFSLELEAGVDYRFIAETEGYQQMIKRVLLSKAGPEDQISLSLNLAPIPKPQRVVPADPFGTLLTVVYFQPRGVSLTDASRAELERLLKLLQANPDVRVAVHGHSDVKGSFEQNMRLAKLRTQAVRAYLMAHDIAPYRLPTISYGNAFRMTSFPKERVLNNRVEFHLKAN